MTITVGTDTYATIAEADAYIAANYLAAETKRTAWEALSDDDKEIYLKRATQSIEAIPVAGIKYNSEQALNFPRETIALIPERRNDYEYFYGGSGEVPDAVKSSQIEEAAELASPSTDTKKFEAANAPLKSYSYGRVSETYDKSVATSKYGIASMHLKSVDAQRLMSRYSGSSFAVR